MSNLQKWIDFYYRRVKPYIGILVTEMKRKGIDKVNAVQIMKGVMERVVKEFRRRFN